MVRNAALSRGAALLCILAGACDKPGDPAQPPPSPASLDVASASGSGVPSPDDLCGAVRTAALIRHEYSPALHNRVRQLAGHEQIRWIRPGNAITSDVVADRLNVILDDSGRVAALRCG
ncbi:I78 family peptidase inhibitor [Novosphingobium sp. KCTC 2891]|uniref:I78 family peptidase inhibitor n=1 Tax=Novosphingobium sp. KCTC 2891 TaxID=2989730 RepID=UPI002221D6E6|nr:I78 family peptidase inhibitor [Novosphingobium sp. KCTC 2891]MCW1381768.1 I78 family peptidase inhibitor [Novosphingobium sp. KCTC 2891]